MYFFQLMLLTIQKNKTKKRNNNINTPVSLKHMYGLTAPLGVKVCLVKDGHRGAEMSKVKDDFVQFSFSKDLNIFQDPSWPSTKM